MIDKTAKVWLGGRRGVTAPIHVSQYDTGWRFLLSVYDGDAVYTGGESTAVYMEGRKDDGTVFAVPGAFSDGVAVVECTASITAAVGPIDCELRISEDGETVGTANFEIIVEAAPLKGYVASGDDFSAMQQVLDGSEEAAADALAAKNAAAASAEAAAVSAATAQVQAGMAYQIAASAADMTDHSIGYVYVGNETGYTYGGWYYWDGTAWTLGGMYVDPTLTVAGAAADAKVTGDAIGDVRSAVDNFGQLYPALTLDLVSGSIGPTGGVTDSNTRIRSRSKSVFFTEVQANDYYVVSAPFAAKVAIYNTTSLFSTNFSGWVNTEFRDGVIAIPKEYVGKYAAIVIEKVGHESDDISGDLATIEQYVKYCRPADAGEEITYELGVSRYTQPVPVTWEQGAISSSNGSMTNADNRVRSSTYFSNPYGYIRLDVPKGWKIGIMLYTAASVTSFYGKYYTETWSYVSDHVNLGNYYYKLVLAKSDDSDITPEDVPEALTITNVLLTDPTYTKASMPPPASVFSDYASLKAQVNTQMPVLTKFTENMSAQLLPGLFAWNYGKFINAYGNEGSNSGAALSDAIELPGGTQIQSLVPDTDSSERTMFCYVNEFEGTTWKKRTQLYYGDTIYTADTTTAVKFCFGYPSALSITLNKKDTAKYFSVKIGKWPTALRNAPIPYLVAFGASTTNCTVHTYTGVPDRLFPSKFQWPEYVADKLGMNVVNLGVGTTGFLARATSGNANNILDQIYANSDTLSKASLVVLMFGYGNDAAVGLPVGVYTDYYPYDAEGYHPNGEAGIATMLSKGITLMGALNWCIKWINEHYPMAQVIPIFGAPSANKDRTITMTAQSEGAGVAPYTLTFADPYGESGTTTNKKIKAISEELQKLKAALNIPIIDMMFDGGAFSWWSTYSSKQVDGNTVYSLFSTTGTPENPVWNSHPNDAGYLRYARALAGRIAGLYQYDY